MVKILPQFMRFALTVILLQSVRSIKKGYKVQLETFCKRMGGSQTIGSFEDLIIFYQASYLNLDNKIKDQFITMHGVRGSIDKMKIQNTITYGGYYNRESTNDKKASLLFTLIATANLLGIYEPPSESNIVNVKVHQIRMICESFALANQAESGFEYATDKQEEEKTPELRQLIKFTALTSTVGYEDVMGTGERAERYSKYVERFKENWQSFRQLLSKNSNLVKVMDEIVANGFTEIHVSEHMIDFVKISGLLGRIIYERSFHEEMTDDDFNVYEQNTSAFYYYKTTFAFSKSFPSIFAAKLESLSENVSVKDMNQLFYDLFKERNREMNQSVFYAYFSLITLGRSDYNQEDFKKYFFSHVFRLILMEEYVELKAKSDNLSIGSEIKILDTSEYTPINLLNQSFRFAYEVYVTSYDVCVNSTMAIARRLKEIQTEENPVVEMLFVWALNFNKHDLAMKRTTRPSPTNKLRNPNFEIEVDKSKYPDYYLKHIDSDVPGFSIIIQNKIADLKSQYRNQEMLDEEMLRRII